MALMARPSQLTVLEYPAPSENVVELTDHEAELYDRQIRLWGVDAQKRLRSAKVLIIGMQGLGCEVSKNVILAGINSITLLDHKTVSANDRCAQFLAPHERIGRNVAEASVERSRQLNPMVKVTADPSNVKDKPDSFFGGFDVIFVSKCPVEVLTRIDRVCRQKNIQFFCGDVFGMFGFMFTDLNVHEYAVEVAGFANGVMEKSTSKQTSTFVSLNHGLDVDWKSEANSQLMNKMDASYFLMKVLLRFRGEQGRDPSPATREKDLEMLRELCPKELAQLDVPVDKIPDELLSQTILEISPVCAILGGVVGWEIIKALSHKDAPLNNFFFFNPLKCVGFSECIGTYTSK